MSPRETRFIKALIDSGVLSFSAAAQLEEARARQAQPETEKFVWDLAVEQGLVTAEQSAEALEQADTAVQAPVKGPGATPQMLGGYELISKLGQGGMGAVFKARQQALDRLVAIKVLPRTLARNQEFIGRFLREARAAGKLSHPNIVAGIDAGFVDGYYYFAMEYIEGLNLGDRLRREGPLDEAEALRIGRQIAEALDYAHRSGLVHRDVKPDNILVTADGQAKLCDLGLARGSAEDLRLTQAGFAVGTPHYIAPEQVRGENPDGRSDLYALGCTLYHLVAGKPPFGGDNPLVIMQKHLSETPPRMSEVRPAVSRAFSAVVEKMMAKKTAERYQTGAEVAADLAKVATGGVPVALRGAMAGRSRSTRGSSTSTRPVGTRASAGAEAVPQTQPLLSAARRNWPLLAAAAGLLLLAAVPVIIWSAKQASPVSSSASSKAVVPEDPFKKQAEQFEAAQAYEAQHLGHYAEIMKLYGDVAGQAAGTPLEAKAREAIAAVRKRQREDQSAERLKALAGDLKKIREFEAANPERYAEVEERYTRFAAGALGTEYEAQARSRAEVVKKRRIDRAAALALELRAQVTRANAAGDFAGALAAIEAFPKAFAPDAARDLGQLRESVLTAGRARWQELVSEGRRLKEGGNFEEAATAIVRGKALGLPGLDEEVRAALAEVDVARKAAEAARLAKAEKEYRKFQENFNKLAGERKFAEARKRGEALAGKLPPNLEASLRSDLAVAAGAESFLKELRAGLAKLKPGAIWVTLPAGKGALQGYEPGVDKLSVRVSVGGGSMDTEVELSALDGTELAQIARHCAGGELSAPASRNTACFLLAVGKPAGVKDLVEQARKGGEDVGPLSLRLAVLERGAREVEAETMLAELDRQVKGKSWSSAVSTGSRLLKDFADTEAVKKRADLAALMEQAWMEGAPVKEYILTFQEGQPIPAAGVAAYKGTRSGTIYRHPEYPDVPDRSKEGQTKCAEGGASFTAVGFALTAAEGGPLPADAEVLEARLLLYKSSEYNPCLEVRRIVAPWNDGEVTWLSSAKGRKWETPGGDLAGKVAAVCDLHQMYSGDKSVWDRGVWCSFDVTESLREALKEGKNHGWRMEGYKDKDHATHMNLVRFAGKGYDPAERRPKLILKVRCKRLSGDTGAALPVNPGSPGGNKVVLQDGLAIGNQVYSGTRDAVIYDFLGNSNFGGEEELRLIEKHHRGLVRFAIFASEGGPVPDGPEVASATLKLYKFSAYPSNVSAHEILKDWVEKETTWERASAREKWEEDGCQAQGKDRPSDAVASSKVEYAEGKWLELNVTASVRKWAAQKGANYGWLLIDEVPRDAQNPRRYRTREYAAEPALRPKLEITWRAK